MQQSLHAVTSPQRRMQYTTCNESKAPEVYAVQLVYMSLSINCHNKRVANKLHDCERSEDKARQCTFYYVGETGAAFAGNPWDL